ncbi:GspH/FimT family pseudopilin [Geobacter sp.]|uniref:GspH/FimT family pseudopilin n=1 Tax=Geobacter sp. TaxID=46610 RepID=UPI00262C94A2|nr:GspH/FimT family pseudopilin [Geobacter sp.]
MITRIANNKGITLIEMMVVVGILGVLAGIATVMFMRDLPKYRLKDATRELFNDIQSARISAVRNGLPCTIQQFPANSNSYRIVQNGSVLKSVDLGAFKGVSFGSLNSAAPEPDSGTFASDQLVVQPSGLATAGSFYLKSDSTPADGREIEVTAAGRPRIKSWTGTGYN